MAQIYQEKKDEIKTIEYLEKVFEIGCETGNPLFVDAAILILPIYEKYLLNEKI